MVNRVLSIMNQVLLAMPTRFASAARSSPEEIELDYQQLALNGVLTQSLDAVPEVVLILNQHRQVIYANCGACEFFRGRLPELLGLRPGELLKCDTARAAPSGCGTGQACRTCGGVLANLESQAGRKSSYECRILRTTTNGFEALDLKVNCSPFPWQGVSHTVFVASDISAEKHRDVLERVFFHDILNLAGGMEGITTLLAEESVAFEEVKGDLCASASALVQEIRSQQMLLAAEHAQLALDLVRIDASQVLVEVQQSYKNHPVSAEHEIVVAPDTGGLAVTSDRAILSRILGNLVKNALEASPAGSQVTLGCRAEPSGGVFTCHNPGCMPPNVQLQMFHRSFSTKGRGRGIGTYSVKLFTEKYLQGHVTFTSSPEAGTTFNVQLPDSPLPDSSRLFPTE